jgi:predicted phosphodiesterase
MRIALLADIHGNLSALEAVLAALQAEAVDQLICLGDVAAVGPQLHEVIARLRDLGCPAVKGNTDAWLSDDAVWARMKELLPPDVAEIVAWNLTQITADDRAYLHALPAGYEMDLGGGQTLLCYHGSPNSYDDILLATTAAEDVDRMLAGWSGTVLAGGHTHVAMLRRHGEMVLLNPGSVGSPMVVFPEIRRNPLWAEYLLLDVVNGRIDTTFRHVLLDETAVLQAAHQAQMPHADWWRGFYQN